MPKPARAHRRTDVRREQIARAALGLVAEGGPRALRIAVLARRVGLAPSAVYRHFHGKDDILVAAIERFRDMVLANVRAVCIESPSALERLHRLLRRQEKLIRHNAPIMPRLAFGDDPTRGAKWRRRVAPVLGEFLSAIADIVTQGQREGEIRRDVPPDTVALMLFGLLMVPTILWHLRGGVGVNIERHVESGWRTLRRAVAVRPGRT